MKLQPVFLCASLLCVSFCMRAADKKLVTSTSSSSSSTSLAPWLTNWQRAGLEGELTKTNKKIDRIKAGLKRPESAWSAIYTLRTKKERKERALFISEEKEDLRKAEEKRIAIDIILRDHTELITSVDDTEFEKDETVRKYRDKLIELYVPKEPVKKPKSLSNKRRVIRRLNNPRDGKRLKLVWVPKKKDPDEDNANQ